MRKKILWLSHLVPYPPQGRGVLQRSSNLLKELAKYHDVYLLAFVQKDLLKHVAPNLADAKNIATEKLSAFCEQVWYCDIESELKPKGKARLALFSLFTKDSYTVNWLKSKPAEKILDNINSTFTFDVVYFDTISLVPYERFFPESRKILGHHNIESQMMFRRAYNEKNILKRMYFYIEAKKIYNYEALVCNNFDVNITCSKLDSERLLEIDNTLNAHVIPNGVNMEQLPQKVIHKVAAGQDCDDMVLIYTGNMAQYANRQAAIYIVNNIWPLVRKQFDKAKLIIVGDNPPIEIQEKSKHDERLTVTGYVDDINAYYKMATIYVCPIKDGGGTKLKILDAMSLNIPIVADKIACEGIDVENGKEVLFASEPEDYIEAIKKLDADRELGNLLTKNSRKAIIEKYDYKIIGKNFADLF